jgi:Flp pilus assembly protein TadD
MLRTIGVCLALASMATACAARGTLRYAEPGAQRADAPAVETYSLEAFMGKVRAASQNARPRLDQTMRIEASAPTLAAALLVLEARPSAARHRTVAREYLRHGILDVAHEHFSEAVALDRRDAAAWDGLARIWRDWGFAHLALPDAYRAVYFAPDSAVAHNTLGTVLQALGRRIEARRQYEQALALDVTAAYALTNVCYGWVLDGETAKAAAACGKALRLQPDLEAARNNLALAYGAGGNLPAALDTFDEAIEEGRAEFNAGILYLARRQFPEALEAFEAAQRLRPRFRAAEALARQARQQVEEENRP